ncbi:MAG: hypothetical protein AAGA37_18145 [Actinomycetota bacterium]
MAAKRTLNADERWEAVVDDTAVPQPGDLVFSRGDKAVSDFIAKMDGYWSHVALMGPKGYVFESVSKWGLIKTPFEKVLARDEGRVGWARLQDEGWAIECAQAANQLDYRNGRKGKANYSFNDCALAGALLARARSRDFPGFGLSEKKLKKAYKALERDAKERNKFGPLNLSERDQATPRSCAGFVYECFEFKSGRTLNPRFDDNLATPTPHTVMSNPFGEDIPEHERRTQTPNSELDRFLKFALFGVTNTVRFAPTNSTLLQRQAVSPGDLWLAMDLTDKRYFRTKEAARRPEGRATAKELRKRKVHESNA